MVKRALLAVLFLSSVSLGATYQINVVKEQPVSGAEKRFVVYRVKKGDTLLKIMRKYKIPRKFLYEIARMNNIKNPDLIYAGQTIRLPVGKSLPVKRGRLKAKPADDKKKTERELNLIQRLGGKVNRSGYLFVGDKKISLRENPVVNVGDRNFLIDFTGLSSSVKETLSSIGISVVDKSSVDKLLKEVISANFSPFQENGTLVVGGNDILTYHYDYLTYNSFTGQRTIINVSPDTPPPLKNLLEAYGISVVEPDFKVPDDREGWGEFKVLNGGGLEKISQLVYLLTGKRGKEIPEGMVFPDAGLAVVYDYITPEKRTKLEIEGYKVFVLTGNFLNDVENILSLVPVANKFVKLILYEPPGTKGKRSKFEISGLLISTEKKDWFLIDSVDKPEEIPYLRYRGVNLIVY